MKFKQITKKEISSYKGKVYDLTVEDAHSYNIDGLIVHNSGAGSLVNYALNITQVNPMKYDLIFDRFLNADRGHLPDIDSDFCIFKGSQVFEHLNKLYGKDHCCNIITFSNLQARAIIKDVSRAFEVPISEVNAITKFVPKDGKDFKEFKELLEIKELKAFFAKHQGVFQHCEKLYGAPRHHSQHPAGICVTPMPITDLMPVEEATPTPNGFVGLMAQFEKENVETAGAVKLDILRLKNISALYNQMEVLKKVYKVDMKLEDIPMDDKKSWDLICSCDTMGIFQMSSPIGKDIIRKIKPRNIEELSAVNAFVRPGTSGLDEYCAAKKDPSKIRKFHPILDKHLAVTMGGIVYQEQIMSLISELLGVSFGKADIYRRALEKPNKKGNVELVKEFEEKSVTEGVKRGIDRKACEDIRKAILDNCAYLFNKSHSIAYSFISYWTAWVKANYPLVFYVSLFNTESVDSLQECMKEAKRHGIVIAPPDISKSKYESIIEDIDNNVIRMGLKCVKGIGEKAVEDLVPNQPFANFQEFFLKNKGGKGGGKAVVEAGIDIGAFENIALIVNQNLIDYEDIGTLTIKQHDENTVAVYMNREQQEIWYKQYLECKSSKAVPNYAIPQDLIKGKYLEKFGDDLIYEKDGTLVIPSPMLEQFGFKEDVVLSYKTRKKPKGILKEEKAEIKLTKEEIAFEKAYDDIVNLKENKISQYLKEMEKFALTFIPHPLEDKLKNLPPFDSIPDGRITRTAGIITNIINRQTKKGKDFKNVVIQTPRETIRLTVWDNIYQRNKKEIFVNAIVKVTGRKGFGGITVDTIDLCASTYKNSTN